MTAVLRFNIGNYAPSLVGDVLLSRPSAVGKLTSVPTVNDVTNLFPSEATWFPCGLRQKLAVFGRHIAIAWGGNCGEAESDITYLYSMYRNGDLTCDELEASLANSQGRYMAYFVDQKGTLHSFGFKCHCWDSTYFGKVGFIGTGANALKTSLHTLEEDDPFKEFSSADKQIPLSGYPGRRFMPQGDI